MNNNSVLCRFIYDHPDDWMTLLSEKEIKVKTDGIYTIFNYGDGADFSDPIVQEARGIILDINSLDVVCWPFRKFCNFQESAADPIDWSTARVQDKIDGSIIKLWYDREQGFWRFSTNGVIDADEAFCNGGMYSFLDLIKGTKEYHTIFDFLIPENILNQDCTYIFELVHPSAMIVVKYDKPKLWHLGTRSNVTGEEFIPDIGLSTPKEYPLHSLDDCIKAAEMLNKNSHGSEVEKEGFVVVDVNWHRIKVKSPEYLLMHRIMTSQVFPYRKVIQSVRGGKFTFDELAAAFPDAEHIVRWYQWQMAEVKNEAKNICRYVDVLSEEFNGERKPIAMAIKNDRFSPIGFTHLSSGKSAEEILSEMSGSYYLRFISPYPKEKSSEKD